MKNVHVLPTDKPSRLLYNSTLKSFCIQKEIDGMFINDGKVSGANFWGLEKALNNSFKPHNIYITSDEEIKEGDWFLDDNNSIGQSYKLSHVQFANPKKIILTTDFGKQPRVQAIDDEFLEWFVKNPSCESVEVERDSREVGGHNGGVAIEYGLYEIIIPKEEVLLQSSIDGEHIWGEPKQEVIEEVAEKYSNNELLISKAPEMLEMLKRLIQPDLDISDLIEAENLIKEATEI